MTEFDKKLDETKKALRALIKDGDTEGAKAIAGVDALIDGLAAENKKTMEAHTQLQSDYIDMVKSTGFKSDVNIRKDIADEKKEMTIEEAIEKVLKNKGDKKNG